MTHYDLAPNTTSDIELLKRVLPELSKDGIKEVYTDSGYYSSDMAEVFQSQVITVRYTNMTGRKKSSKKFAYSDFVIENRRKTLFYE